ncbi:phage holin family protein [Candidatus Bathyarchaeota archaeon]|nr:phage holin family protein [Candidatus Bathyarchaeota archaeon]
MVSKDQSIGGAIFLVCVVIAVLYTLIVFFPKVVLGIFGPVDEIQVRIWAVIIPVFIAFIAIMGIGAWIGWTMATTPPPKPIEEITSEIEEEEKKEEAVKESTEAAETEEKGKSKTKK